MSNWEHRISFCQTAFGSMCKVYNQQPDMHHSELTLETEMSCITLRIHKHTEDIRLAERASRWSIERIATYLCFCNSLRWFWRKSRIFGAARVTMIYEGHFICIEAVSLSVGIVSVRIIRSGTAAVMHAHMDGN